MHKVTHQTIFETALGKAFEMKIVEAPRKGGRPVIL
jgi:hypothetical protein